MEKLVDDKKAELTLTTIIVIILGIVVLVFLIFGFSSGWNNLWDRITNLGGGNSNLDTIATACQLACSTNNQQLWCNDVKEIKYGKTIKAWNGTASDDVKSSKAVCEYIVNNKERFGNLSIEPCPSIKCN